jgi:4-diphosphocytidyl-2-C-methyl-D-erythritol kinase
VRVRAFAKINLSLRVLGARPDGFHELRTLFQSIALHDTLTITKRRGALVLTCDNAALPVDGRNLIVRAACAAWTASGRRGAPRHVRIDLVKRIPLAAGLGGGSSDAAAALKALGTLWHVDEGRLRAIASALGADVPYFLEGGTVLGVERGDVLHRQTDHPARWVVLALPDFGVSTPQAFGWFDADRGRSSFRLRQGYGGPPKREARRLVDRLRMSGTRKPLALSLSKGELTNDLQRPVAKRHPEIARLVTSLRRAGASHAAMSGSGSTVFGLFTRHSTASAAARAVESRTGTRTLVTRTVSRAAYRRLAAK